MLRGAIGMRLVSIGPRTNFATPSRRFHFLLWWVFGITVIVGVNGVEVVGLESRVSTGAGRRCGGRGLYCTVPYAIFKYNSFVVQCFHFRGLFWRGGWSRSVVMGDLGCLARETHDRGWVFDEWGAEHVASARYARNHSSVHVYGYDSTPILS
jgi:hypothetical protein